MCRASALGSRLREKRERAWAGSQGSRPRLPLTSCIKLIKSLAVPEQMSGVGGETGNITDCILRRMRCGRDQGPGAEPESEAGLAGGRQRSPSL